MMAYRIVEVYPDSPTFTRWSLQPENVVFDTVVDAIVALENKGASLRKDKSGLWETQDGRVFKIKRVFGTQL